MRATITLTNLKSVALDSNIFIYYFEANPVFGGPAKKVLNALSTKTLSGVTSVLTLTELLSKKDLPNNIAKRLEADFFEIPNLSILELNSEIAVVTARIRRLYGFRLPDSIQLATALGAKVQAFITNDKRLKKFRQLKTLLLSEI